VLLLLSLLPAAFTLINRSLLTLAGIPFLDLAKLDVFHERGLEPSERFIDCKRSTQFSLPLLASFLFITVKGQCRDNHQTSLNRPPGIFSQTAVDSLRLSPF
jgi:hypothetical protein